MDEYPDRRSVLRAAAWSAPIVAFAIAAPASSASTPLAAPPTASITVTTSGLNLSITMLPGVELAAGARLVVSAAGASTNFRANTAPASWTNNRTNNGMANTDLTYVRSTPLPVGGSSIGLTRANNGTWSGFVIRLYSATNVLLATYVVP